MVLIAIVVVGVFFWFVFANAIQGTQEAINPNLSEDKWASATHYLYFAFANNFLTYLWTFLVGVVVAVAAYWVWIYTQRKEAGY